MGIGRIKSSPDVGQVSDEQRVHRAHRVDIKQLGAGKCGAFWRGPFILDIGDSLGVSKEQART